MFDLRRRGKVDKLSMCGVSARSSQPSVNTFGTISRMSTASIPASPPFPPTTRQIQRPTRRQLMHSHPALPLRSSHPIIPISNSKYAIERKIHVLITKPATKLLSDHLELLALSRKNNVFVYIEHHKRFDPAYADARYRAAKLGDFNYFYSYMSQPKSQLATFSSWAGKDSDISYYLNSHHIDICDWLVSSSGWRPTLIRASSSLGIAHFRAHKLRQWNRRHHHPASRLDKSLQANSRATAIFTASWTAPQNAGVHSQQNFHYIGTSGRNQRQSSQTRL